MTCSSLIEKPYGKDLTEIRYVEHFESGGDAVLNRMSLEGIVSKQADARYSSGRGAARRRSRTASGQARERGRSRAAGSLGQHRHRQTCTG